MIDGSTRATDWDDKQGHGTHCAGVIGARDNDIGVVGVAPEANIWAVKVLSDDRSGYISDVIQGLEWCVDNGIEIASMSFVGAYSTSLEEACDPEAVRDGDDHFVIGRQVIRAGLAAGESATLTYIWDTQGAMTGVHTLMASHDFADDNADNDAHMATVAIVEVALPEVVVNYVTPHGLWAGMQSSLMIRGDGFCEGLSIAFEGPQGLAPTVTSIRVMGSGSLVSRVTTPSELPLGPVTWDVRITNPDGSSGVLHQAFTVQP